MRTREFAFVGGTVAFLATIAATSAVAQVKQAVELVPAEETALGVADPENWQVPRTSWGHPSFEGIWTNDGMRGIPTERPEQYGTRRSLTTEEFAERSSGSNRRGGTRVFGYTSLVIDPPNGRIPAMTEAPARAAAAYGRRGTWGGGPFNTVEDFTVYDRCITRGIYGSTITTAYNNALRFFQTPDSVVIGYEMLPEARVIDLDGRPHVDENIRQYLGDARGHWEGDTLVVETRNLTDKTSISGNGNGVSHSEVMTMTERFTRVDPEMIEYVVTMEDPMTYKAPFTVRIMLTSAPPGYEMFEYACHEDNMAVRNSLAGERYYEKRVAEALASGRPSPERIPTGGDLGGLPEDVEFSDVNRGEHRE